MTKRRSYIRPAAFTGAYLAVWGAAGVIAYALYALGRHAFGGQLAWHSGGRWLAGAVLVVAALYELTPLKDVCLSKCRSPFGFLLAAWRDGVGGAFSMGSRHAAWCLGCCWALMAALFALGVMSILWMAVVAALITIEKVVPWRRIAVWSTTLVLLVLALGVLAAPGSVPGFVVPGGAMTGM
jgi:predicted metal-binding membrane protein